jgi:hypothetical protein
MDVIGAGRWWSGPYLRVPNLLSSWEPNLWSGIASSWPQSLRRIRKSAHRLLEPQRRISSSRIHWLLGRRDPASDVLVDQRWTPEMWEKETKTKIDSLAGHEEETLTLWPRGYTLGRPIGQPRPDLHDPHVRWRISIRCETWKSLNPTECSGWWADKSDIRHPSAESIEQSWIFKSVVDEKDGQIVSLEVDLLN